MNMKPSLLATRYKILLPLVEPVKTLHFRQSALSKNRFVIKTSTPVLITINLII